MKTRFLLTLFIAVSAYIIFSSRTTGAGFNGIGDVTGSPVSGGTCANCHSGGSFGGSVSITLRDGSNNPVSAYVPGQSYVLEIDVNNSTGSPAGFGAQAVVLTGSNANAGTMGSVITTNTRTLAISGRSYLEQSNISSNGLFRVNWTAPAAGTGTIRVYAAGNIVNGSGTLGDQVVTNNIQITEQVQTTVSYNQASYCQNNSDPSPQISGNTGGTFSAGAGLSIGTTTGIIDVSASAPGSYTVTYTHAGGSATASVQILANDQATLSYGSNPSYCGSASTVSPTITGVQTGTFSASPAGLNINPVSGVVAPGNSIVQSYTVSFTTNGPCPVTVTAPITVLAGDNANFSYNGASFCTSGANAVPTTPVSAGVFTSSPAGLSLAANGTINVAGSNVGNYTVTYTTNGVCPDTHSVNVQITNAGSALFTYGQAAFCSNVGNPMPSVSGQPGGVFSASSTGLSIDASTGIVSLSASDAGTYTVYYTIGGSCPALDSTEITINEADAATIDYGTLVSFCQTNTQTFTPNIIGTQGGNFSSSPSGLNISSSTGSFNPNASSVGNYTVSYTTTGICPDIATANIAVLADDIAQITYNTGIADFNSTIQDTVYSFFCVNPISSPIVIGAQGGTFATNETAVLLDANNGQISMPLGDASFGPSSFTYSTAGACPVTDTFWVSSDCTNAIHNIESKLAAAKIYPNPVTNGQITINCSCGAEEFWFDLYNELGQKVQSDKAAGNDEKHISLNPELPKANYFLMLRSMKEQKMFRISVQ